MTDNDLQPRRGRIYLPAKIVILSPPPRASSRYCAKRLRHFDFRHIAARYPTQQVMSQGVMDGTHKLEAEIAGEFYSCPTLFPAPRGRHLLEPLQPPMRACKNLSHAYAAA
jgi:hypothetical protein